MSYWAKEYLMRTVKSGNINVKLPVIFLTSKTSEMNLQSKG